MASTQLEGILEQAKTLSPEEQQELRMRLKDLMEETHSGSKEDELERRLLEAGLLSEIPPPITDLNPYQNREPGKTTGKPLSEVIIEERR